MNEAELIKIWKKSSDMNRINVNMPLLVAELRNTMESIDRKISKRDQLEVIASIIGMIAFGYLAWSIPFFWTKVACVFGIGWFIYVIYRLKSTSKHSEPDSSLPLWDQLEQRKNYLKKQAQMLRDILYWYILPPFAMNVLFFFGVGEEGAWDSPLAFILPYSLSGKLIVISYVFLLYAYITWANLKAAKTEYPPLIAEIERVQDELNMTDDKKAI